MLSNDNIDEVIKRMRKQLEGFPDPSVTLVGKKWKSPFLVLISCLLSLRTKDQTTLPASERLFALAETPQAMVKLKEDVIRKAIFPVGFYKTKAKRIIGICRDLIDRFKGKVPGNMEDLLSLNGVGRKTANLVLTEGFGTPAICVDTHVHRISNRLGYLKTKAPHETEMELRKKLPLKFWIDYNALLVMWGQNICKPVSPLCSQCSIKLYCARCGVTVSR